MDKKLAGNLSFFGTFLLLFSIGLYFSPLDAVFHDLRNFFNGHALDIERATDSLLVVLPIVLLISCLDIIISMPIALLTKIFLPTDEQKKKRGIAEVLFDPPKNEEKRASFFATFFLLVIVEELFARLLFLGILTKVSFLSGTGGFYFLLLAGNSIWALAHIYNYKPVDRHPIRVVTQFLGGFLHSYIFVKYGLMMCIFSHFIFNAMIFAGMKARDVNRDNFVSMLQSGLMTLGILWLMRRPLMEAASWLDPSITFSLEGWSVWDYALISVLASFALKFVMDTLLYDRRNNDAELIDKLRGQNATTKLGYVIGVGIVALVAPLVIALLYWIAGIFFDDTPNRVLMTCLPLALLNTNMSLSAGMRVFWVVLPNLYILTCVVEGPGCLVATQVMLVEIIFVIPFFFIGSFFKKS